MTTTTTTTMMMVMTLVKLQHVAVLSVCLNQGEATRRREQELVKLRKDIELLTVQHESSEASLRKRHQEAINELNDQLEQLSKHRNKCAQRLFTSLHAIYPAVQNTRPAFPTVLPFRVPASAGVRAGMSPLPGGR